MTDENNTRLTDLEIQSAHLSRTVDELNDVVAKQANVIDSLTKRVTALMERAAQSDIDGGEAAPLADQVPPHW